MILSFLGTVASVVVLLLSLGVIGRMIHAHWRQIAMALNAEILLQPDPIPPVPLVRPAPIRMMAGFPSPELRPSLRAAA